MVKGKDKYSLGEIVGAILILLIFFFIIIYLVGEDNSKENKQETITISGMGEIITITNSNPLKVYITGMNAVVYFSASSNPQEIYLTGMNSIAYLCEGIHNPTISASGMNAKTIYRIC